MMRHINILRAVLLAFTFAMLLFISWIINSESGLRWTVERVQPYLPGELQIDNVSGRLSGPVRIDSLHYQLDDLQVGLIGIVVNWTPSALLLGQLEFSEVSAQQLDVKLPAPDPQAETEFTLPHISSPINIDIEKLELGEISIQPHQQKPMEVSRLGLRASMHHDNLKLSRLEVVIPSGQLELKGKAELDKLYVHELHFSWNYTDTHYGYAKGEGELVGDLKQTVFEHNLSSPISVFSALTLNELLEQPSWQGRLSAKSFALQQLSPELPMATVAANINIKGDTKTQAIDGNIASNSDMLGEINGEYQLAFTQGLLLIKQLHLQSPDDSRSANLQGQWRLGDEGGQGELALSWHGLSWPMQGAAEVSSANGGAYYTGNSDNFQLSIAADLESPHWSDSHLRGIGSGNLQGLNLTTARLMTLDGELFGPVQLAWEDAFSWQASLTGKQLNPGRQWPEWPGKINLAVSSQGNIKEAIDASLDIKQLDGTLRQYPVRLKGDLAWRNEILSLNKIDFHSADSNVKADGKLGEQISLQWQVDSNDLIELYPDVHGRVNTTGSLTGTREKPLLQFELSGEQLAWQEHSIGTIKTTAKLDLFSWQQLQLDTDAKALMLFGQSLDALQIKLAGDHQQQLILNAKHQIASLQLQADGVLSDQRWQGNLSHIQINSEDFGDWQQQTANKLSVSAEHLSIEPLCLINGDSSVCLSADWRQQQWQGKLEGNKVALNLLSPWLGSNIKLHGSADIHFQASYITGQSMAGQGQLVLHPGNIEFLVLDDEWNNWEYQQGRMNIHLDDKGLRTSTNLDMNAQDYLNFNVELAKFNPLKFDASTQQIDSTIEMKFSQINLFQNLLDEANDLRGKLQLQAHAHGLLSAPSVQGKLSLTEGSINIPTLGLEISGIDINASSKDQQVDYQLSATSGSGQLTAKGQTQLDSKLGWPTEIQIKGEQFDVSNIPDVRIRISPDIHLSLQNRRIDVNGTVHIPYARLRERDLSSAKLPSEDAVIYSDEPVPEEKWQIYSSIRLILGERVNLYAYSFDGRLGGNVLLIDEPNKPPIGVGELNVQEGKYRNIDIEHGSLLFASSPLNNPGLSLRATRKVQGVTAGITVKGTLIKPNVEFFSIPAMGQKEILSYLILGRPLDNKSDSDQTALSDAMLALGLMGGDVFARKLGDEFGVDDLRLEASDDGGASMVIGHYLSPKLYVSYGIGLIESVNTLRLRYQLSNRWQVEAESSSELGADLLYTIER